MTYIENLINWTRIKALLWHTAAQIAAFLLADLATAISNHQIIIPAWAAILVGLLIAQATKALYNYLSLPTTA